MPDIIYHIPRRETNDNVPPVQFGHIDIGNFRESPVQLYDLCMQLAAISDTTAWDKNSTLYHLFHALLNDLWEQLPMTFTIDLREPDEEE